MLKFSDYTDRISKAVHYHVENKIPLAENIYRLHSEEFYKLFREARELYRDEVLEVTSDWDKHLLETDIGEFGIYEGKEVPLDLPIEEEDKIKKVTWGDTTGLSVKLKNPEARKSFAARHRCAQQKDKTKAAYWACNLPRHAKSLGMSGGGNFYW